MATREKILIVDDRRENLVALRQVLSEIDTEVIEASSGNEALRLTLHHEFALAILDVLMPGMDGYELACLLRGDARTQRLPIIFLTATDREEAQVFKGYEAGAVDYLVKPYNPLFLLSKVRVFLELHAKNAALAEKVAALAASEERYRSLVMTVPDIVYRVDPDGRFTFLNDAVRLLGYRPEELIGEHFTKIIAPEDAEAARHAAAVAKLAGQQTGPADSPRLFDERRSGPRMTTGLELRLLSRTSDHERSKLSLAANGGFFLVEVNSSGVYSKSEEGEHASYLGCIGVIRDISERKRAELELARYREHLEDLVAERTKELEARNREISDLNADLEQRVEQRTAELRAANAELESFTYSVSHDLRAPLRAMSGLAQILADGYADRLGQAGRQRIDQIVDSARRMQDLIEGLLQLSHSTRGELQRVPVDLSALACRTLEEHAAAEPSRAVRWEIEEGLIAEGDPRMLEVLMQNLLGNAWKYTGRTPDALIRVHADHSASPLRYFVIDNGAGFNMAHAGQLFQPFRRLHSQSEFQGIGIGLATVQRIVHRHGGEIHVDATPGQGARFFFTLATSEKAARE
jgi:PAS domain S-box-containing protein